MMTRQALSEISEIERVPFREICEPYSHLMRGIEEVKQSQTLQSLIALTLAVGNEMNRSNVKCFDLNSLLKLSSIKGPSPSLFNQKLNLEKIIFCCRFLR